MHAWLAGCARAHTMGMRPTMSLSTYLVDLAHKGEGVRQFESALGGMGVVAELRIMPQ